MGHIADVAVMGMLELDMAGMPAKAGFSCARSAVHGPVSGIFRSREVTGLVAPSFYSNKNFYGLSAGELMKYIEKEQKLIIDLSKDEYTPEIILAYAEMKCLRIDECNERFELPIELSHVETLDTLYISGADREKHYDPPINIEKLTNIRNLSLWSYCDLTKLSLMPHIETLDVVVQNPFEDMKDIILNQSSRLKMWSN